MNRRSFFSSSSSVMTETLLPETTTTEKTNKNAAKPASIQYPTSGLASYQGSWGKQQAAHLLRRTMFGPNQQEIDTAVSQGMTDTVKQLLTLPTIPDLPPINFEGPADVLWHIRPNQEYNQERKHALKGWWIDKMLHQGMSIQEKLALFWHNHLVTSLNGVNDARLSYTYLQLIRGKGLGNFKTLVYEFTKNPATLVYLHGNLNKKGSPNEDFARELMELFTLGRETPGGIKNYTEQDVIEVARALTGWVTIPGNTGIEPLQSFVGFSSASHDTGVKQFSEHFGNKIIQRSLPTEYEKEMDDVIDMIFSRPEVSEFICRELYRWFVYYDIDSNAEQNVIVPLAKAMRDLNYEIKPILEILLSSEHFYDSLVMGAMLKNPVDFCLGTVRQTYDCISKATLDVSPQGRYYFAMVLQARMADLQMDILDPPNVAGWKAYYQAPAFYETWLNTATLLKRLDFLRAYLEGGIAYNMVNVNGAAYNNPIQLDSTRFFLSVCNGHPEDVNQVLDGITSLLFPQGITTAQRQKLMEYLMGSLSDSEWTKEWLLSVAKQNEPMVKRIRSFLSLSFSMAEFQLA